MYAMITDRMKEECCDLFNEKLICRTPISAEIRYSCKFSARLFSFDWLR
jgi:hypothetical protein